MEPITERWNQFVLRIQNAIVTCSVYGGPAGAVSAVVPQLLNGHGLRSGQSGVMGVRFGLICAFALA